jgi:hypothetical protein
MDMKSSLLILLAFVTLVVAAGCYSSGQKQTRQGAVQMPGERPARYVALIAPPDSEVRLTQKTSLASLKLIRLGGWRGLLN